VARTLATLGYGLLTVKADFKKNATNPSTGNWAEDCQVGVKNARIYLKAVKSGVFLMTTRIEKPLRRSA